LNLSSLKDKRERRDKMFRVEILRGSITRLAARALFGMEEWGREIVKKFIPDRAIAYRKNIGGYGRS